MTAAREGSALVRLVAAVQRPASRRRARRPTRTTECRQCGGSGSVHILRPGRLRPGWLGRPGVRYWCQRCGAVVTEAVHPTPPPGPPAPDPRAVLPAALLRWAAGWSPRPVTMERLDKAFIHELYRRWDAHLAAAGPAERAALSVAGEPPPLPGLPSFAVVVNALHDACYRAELVVEALVGSVPADQGVARAALRERTEHARRWLALRGTALCWITDRGAEPDRAAVEAAALALRSGTRPAPDAGRAVRATLFGTRRGPMLRTLSAVYSPAELAAAAETWLRTGEHPLREDVLARLAAPLPDRVSPATRAGRYAIGRATLTSLLAGRGSYRLVQLAATVLLLPVWGAGPYGTYAAAVASFSWLTALVFTGPEKTVLKLLPRAPRTGPLITGALLALLWLVPLPLVAAYALVRAFGAGDRPAVYVGVATLQLTTGCTLLLVGLHRAAGRPRADSRTFLAMTVAQVVMLVAAASGHLQPVGYVAAIVVVQLALNAVLAGTLGRPSTRILHRRGFLRRLAWTAVLMGGADVCFYLSTGVLFALLAASAWAGQVGRLFVVEVVWSAGVNLLIYVLRVYAPQTSLRQAGPAARHGRRRAGRLAAAIALANAAWLVALGLVLAGTDVAAVSSPAGQTLLWTVLLASRAPALAGLIWAGYLLENSDATATRVTGLAAVVGVVTAAGAGLVAVPALGGIGVIASLAMAELAQAVVLAARAAPRTARGGGAGSGGRPFRAARSAGAASGSAGVTAGGAPGSRGGDSGRR